MNARAEGAVGEDVGSLQAGLGLARPSTMRRPLVLVAAIAASALTLAACGGGGGSSSTSTSTTINLGGNPASKSFSTATVGGLGSVLVDGAGRTVYALTNGGTKNLPCTSASGCTAAWPPLPFPVGTVSATASGGANASLLSTTSVGAQTYPTYNGWVLYEYAGDTAAGQANGQGIQSFGGTWHAVSPDGSLITAATTGTTGSTGGGW